MSPRRRASNEPQRGERRSVRKNVVIALAGLPLNMEGVTAAPLLQIPPTSTPVPPTDTPLPPTNTPVSPTDTPPPPTGTSIAPPPPAGTSTPIPPARKPRSGGGAPPGPSGTPTVNGCVRSIGEDGISLSTEPGFYQPHVQIVPRDHLAQVLAGPVRADNIWWWQLRAETGAEGWGNQDEMTPDPGPCAFGSSVAGGSQTAPYPVTIMPAFALEQTPVVEQAPVPAAPLAQPAPQATPAQQEALPQTGAGQEWWFLAGLLAVTVLVVGFVRRRLQTQPVVSSRPPDEETKPEE